MNTSVSVSFDRACTALGLGVAVSVLCSVSLAGNPNPEWDSEWSSNEAGFLTNHLQITDADRFVKAGEAYFSHDGSRIIFQGIPVPAEGDEALEHYLMYVCDVVRDEDGQITGVNHMTNLSNIGSSNTCGWFHPSDSSRVLFGTTLVAPSGNDVAGFQRETSKYSWQFPREMDMVEMTLSPAIGMCCAEMGLSEPELIWERDGYDAEGSWSPDGRFILYTRLEPGDTNGDLWIYDSKDESHTELIAEPGYDGGPFFSPDGKSICYRSDRNGDKVLQIFVATLAFDSDGKVTGIKEEIQITKNKHVNWCPFYTPDGKYLFYASSEISHGNYEVFCVDATGQYPLDETPRMRITNARGFDGLPVFSPDGKTMMWTAQRGAFVEGAGKPSSQMWVADIDLEKVDKAYKKLRKAMIEKKQSEAFESYTP
ncbi:MAG: PD40 domain-containing protein [Phycisphaerales bacterium]|nr:PD40 domain-containing protein [Phycisphaerales bacterium]